MRVLRFDSSYPARGRPLTTAPLAASGGYDKAWLQGLLFDHPELLPLDVIDPGAGPRVPVCRELALPNGGTPECLVILGVTPTGRLVLVERKLRRNPQARREVVGQLLEYAARLRTWTYADLTAPVRARIGHEDANPLFERTRAARRELDETRFVEAVAAGLTRGDLTLIVAGDGQPLAIEDTGDDVDDDVEQKAKRGSTASKAANRAFWDKVMGSIAFSHPDQAPPRHGGDNRVRVPLPAPCRPTLHRYRRSQRIGAFVTVLGAKGQAVFPALGAEGMALEAEVGEPLEFAADTRSGNSYISTSHRMPIQDPGTADEPIEWPCRIGDRLATAVRTRP